MTNLKVMNCLNKNLMTHFVWYLEIEKKYEIATLWIDRVLSRENFYENSCRKYAPKASSKLLFNFDEETKTAIPCKKLI